jgi:hypothetical protein
VRNYDALGGQLLFAFLHQRDVLVWSENRLSIDWLRLDSEIAALRDELRALYNLCSACSKMTKARCWCVDASSSLPCNSSTSPDINSKMQN